jgi:hypothetical protein
MHSLLSVNMDVIIKVTVLPVNFLVLTLLDLLENLLMKESVLYFNYIVLDVNVKIPGKVMCWFVVKVVLKHFIKIVALQVVNLLMNLLPPKSPGFVMQAAAKMRAAKELS